MVYVVLFPQLTLVIYGGDYTNTYGCLVAFVMASVFRILSESFFFPFLLRVCYQVTCTGSNR